MKQGFTLIELLAVIVILAIIALIATPIVLSIINDSKEGAVLRSAEFYTGALETQIARKNMDLGGTLNPKKCVINSDGNAVCSGLLLEVDVDGEKPIEGMVVFQDGKIDKINLTYKDGNVMTGAKGGLVFRKESLQDLASQKYLEYKEKVNAGDEEVANKEADDWVKEQLLKEGIDSSYIVIQSDGTISLGTSTIAQALIDKKVPIGTKVMGYDISQNQVKSFTTDGKEYTTFDNLDGIPQTVNVATDVSWTYMGISETGEALIVLDLDEASVADADASGVYTTMALGGIGGWFNGVDTLNQVCDKLYSTSKGKARSINYEDVLTGLKWDGPIGQYTTETGTIIKINEPKTIGELMVDDNSLDAGSSVTTATPDYPIYYRPAFHDYEVDNTTNINTYKIGYIMSSIRKSTGELDVDAQYVKADPTMLNVILGTQDINYWIADTCTGIDFKINKANYYMRRGGYKNISGYAMAKSLYSNYSEDQKTLYMENSKAGDNGKVVVRPVVELSEDVTFEYKDGVLHLN